MLAQRASADPEPAVRGRKRGRAATYRERPDDGVTANIDPRDGRGILICYQDRVATQRKCDRLVTDGDRRDDTAHGRVDPGDGLVEAVRHPDRTVVADRHRRGAVPDRDGEDGPGRSRIELGRASCRERV